MKYIVLNTLLKVLVEFLYVVTAICLLIALLILLPLVNPRWSN